MATQDHDALDRRIDEQDGTTGPQADEWSRDRSKGVTKSIKADTYWQRMWALIPMALSVVMVLVGVAFTMGLVARQDLAVGFPIYVVGLLLSIRNWRALSARTKK